MQDSYSEDEISLTDILFFLQDSIGNVIKSVLACLLLGGAYYFSTPKLYEASATIQMAMATGNPVETPTVLLEKVAALFLAGCLDCMRHKRRSNPKPKSS
jgi:uncharacterized protein involved in exopolysaccharide biosynthesis